MKKRNPFTALELVLVITISAILLAISLPAFYNLTSGRRLTAAMTAIAANISLARAQAVSGNMYVALIFYSEGEAMRLAKVNKGIVNNGTTVVYFSSWLPDSSWEPLEKGVIIPSGAGNFYVDNGSSTATPVEVTVVDFSDIGGEKSVNTTQAIIFSPRGRIESVGAVTNPIVLRVAEGTKPPGAGSYVLKKTGDKVNYGKLTVNPLTCRTEMDYE